MQSFELNSKPRKGSQPRKPAPSGEPDPSPPDRDEPERYPQYPPSNPAPTDYD